MHWQAVDVTPDLWRRVDGAGRDRSEIDVSFTNQAGGSPGTPEFDGDASLRGLAELSALGVTWTSTSIPSDSVDRAIEALERYGDEVIQAA